MELNQVGSAYGIIFYGEMCETLIERIFYKKNCKIIVTLLVDELQECYDIKQANSHNLHHLSPAGTPAQRREPLPDRH